MEDILEAFAKDQLRIDPLTYKGNEEYKAAVETACRLSDELGKRLDEEGRELLDLYTDALSEGNYQYSADRFINGYRLGVLMTMEVFSGSGKLF